MKVKQLKRMLSVTLTAAMLVTSVPMSTYAGDTEPVEAVASTDQPDPAEEPPAPAATQTSPSEQQPAPAAAQTSPSEQQPAPAAAQTSPSEQQSAPAAQTSPSEQQSAPAAQTSPSEQQSAPIAGQTPLSKQQSTPAAGQSTPAEGQTSPAEGQNDPTNGDGSMNGDGSGSENGGGTQGGSEQETQPGSGGEVNPDLSQDQNTDSKELSVTWSLDNGVSLEWNGFSQAPTASTSDPSVELNYNYTKDGIPVNKEEVKEPASYTVTVSTADPHIILTDNSRTFTITRKTVTADWTFLEAVYSGKEIALPEATFTDIQGNKVFLNVTCAEKIQNVKEYQLTAALKDDGQKEAYDAHYIIKGTGTFTVKPCQVTIIWKNDSATYDGESHTLGYETVCESCGTFDSKKISVSYKGEDGMDIPEPIQPGTYTATATISEDANHEITQETCTHTLTIKKLEVLISPTVTEKEYDGSPTSLDYYLSITDGLVAEKKIRDLLGEHPLTYGESEDVGSYEVKLTEEAIKKVESSGYHIVPQGTFTIKSCKVELNWENAAVIYDKNEHSLKFSWEKKLYPHLQEGDVVVSYKKADDGTPVQGNGPKNAGVYTATAEIAKDQKNYELKEDSLYRTLTIQKLPITITANPKQGKYYGTVDPELTYTISGLPQDSNITEDDIREALGKTPLSRESGETVGSYAIHFVADPLNYEVTYTGADFVIEKLPIVVKASAGQSRLYGQADPETFDYVATAVPAAAGLTINPDDIKTELGSGILARVKAEGEEDVRYAPAASYEYELTEKAKEAKNFDIQYQEGEQFQINPLPITITANKDQWKYFDTPTKPYTYVVKADENALLNENEIITDLKHSLDLPENAELLTRSPQGEEEESEIAGSYKLRLAFDTEKICNYTITYQEADYKIVALPVVVTAPTLKKYYGQEDPQTLPTEYLITISEDAFSPEDAQNPERNVRQAINSALKEKGLENLLYREPGENKGTYPIKFHLEKVPNYDIEFVDGTLEIMALPVTVTAIGDTICYGQKDPAYAFDISVPKEIEIVREEKEIKADIAKALTRNKSEAEFDPAGEYEYRLDETAVKDLTNYSLTLDEKSGKFTIKPLPVRITADKGQNKYYGAKDPELTHKTEIRFDEMQASQDDMNITVGQIDRELANTILKREDGEYAGVYKLSLTFDPASKTNFDITFTEADFTIKQLPVTVKAKAGQKKIYGQPDPKFDYDVVLDKESTHTEKTEEDIKTELETFEQNSGNHVLARAKGNETGDYLYELAVTETPNLLISYEEQKDVSFLITPLSITVTAQNAEKYYRAPDPEWSYKVTINDENITEDYTNEAEDIEKLLGSPDEIMTRTEGEDVGTYDIFFTIDKLNDNYTAEFVKAEFTIKKFTVYIYAEDGQSKQYSQEDPLPFGYEIRISAEELESPEDTLITEPEIKDELDKEFNSSILKREDGETVGEYAYHLAVKKNAPHNYTLKYMDPEDAFVIEKLPITLTADPGQWKYYGDEDPYLLTLTISNEETDLDPEDIREEINEEMQIDYRFLEREEGEDAGEYFLSLTFDPELVTNYEITYEDDVFAIIPLPVTVIPNEPQEKIFGQKEPDFYGYTVEITTLLTNLTNEMVMDELGSFVLQREPGEAVGTYSYSIISEDSYLYAYTNFHNFDLTVAEDAPEFIIHPVTITEAQAINSRQNSFHVTTDLTGERQPGVVTKFQVEAVSYPVSADGITFSANINDYIKNATAGIVFTGEADTITIKSAEYRRKRNDNGKMLKWSGYLPAGTTIHVNVVDEQGTVVSAKPAEITVTPVSMEMSWSGYETSSSTGNYITANNGAATALSLTGNRTGELAEVMYNGAAAAYEALNLTFTPSVRNSDLSHAMQNVTANIVDTLNLVCESKSLQFYVDDSAFTIPASSIQFENRGDKITIRLPEMGTLTSVTIEGATVEVSGGMGQDFSLPVTWSGKNLIPTGTAISVAYTDQAGHQGTGTASAARSSVTTPITFRIRPELNADGYLNGLSHTLIVSGTACSCEPIRVTVAGMSQTTNAAQADVWSDSNGSWEVLFQMDSLPERQDFNISAEYLDVNGSGYSMTARYDKFCASPSMVSPIFEAMSHISGMVEPGTAVALVINGEKQNYYEIDVDRFGRFSMDDVPMMFGGEDSFDIYVTDIAGNVSIRHYEIEEPGDPFEVTAKVNPLGKFFYSAQENDSVTHIATPVSIDDFEDGKDSVEIPLLMGMSYEVGTMTLHKTEKGFTVSAETQVTEDINEEDYRFENEALYVYTTRPTIDDLKNRTGRKVTYGEEIALSENSAVWIVDERDMTILADDIIDLELYDYNNSKEYVKYQEK